MKRILLFCAFFTFKNYGQDVIQKAVSIHQPATYTVNSKGYMGNGQTSIAIPIFLPENTKEIVYSISSSKKGSVFSGNSILSQSIELLSHNPIVNIAGNLIAMTSNNGAGESYKINTFFLADKDYQLWSANLPSKHFPDLSRKNITQGTVGFRFPSNLKLSGRYWLILKNESDWTGVDVNVEVIAITEKEDLSNNVSSSGNSKSKMYNDLSWKFFLQGNLDKALENGLKALEEDGENGLVKCNLGIFCFFMEKTSTATNYFVEAIDTFKKDKINGKRNLINEYNKLLKLTKEYEVPNIEDVNFILDLMYSEVKSN